MEYQTSYSEVIETLDISDSQNVFDIALSDLIGDGFKENLIHASELSGQLDQFLAKSSYSWFSQQAFEDAGVYEGIISWLECEKKEVRTFVAFTERPPEDTESVGAKAWSYWRLYKCFTTIIGSKAVVIKDEVYHHIENESEYK